MKLFLVLLAVGAAVASAELAELLKVNAGTRIQDSYIVVLKNDVSLGERDSIINRFKARASLLGETVKINRTFKTLFKGFAGDFSKKAMNLVRSFPQVKYVEEDQIMRVQQGITWGLDRTDQTDLPLDNRFSPEGTGKGTHVYVIDTGLNPDHVDFEDRASVVFDSMRDESDPAYGIDCNGHGTHCGGTIGGKTWGVAKMTKLYGVRVLSCLGSGTNSGVVAGMEWVAENHNKPAVASMSLGGGASPTTDAAVDAMHDAGVVVVVAAGNDDGNACLGSPARAPNAITVGATDNTDTRAYFSNYGTCVDIFAPGVSITSTWIGSSNQETNTISGTSMACPHVSGAVAVLRGLQPFRKVNDLYADLMTMATPNKVVDPQSGSPNMLLYI